MEEKEAQPHRLGKGDEMPEILNRVIGEDEKDRLDVAAFNSSI